MGRPSRSGDRGAASVAVCEQKGPIPYTQSAPPPAIQLKRGGYKWVPGNPEDGGNYG